MLIKFEILEGSENYTAIVVRVQNKRKLEGLDNLEAISIFGNQILVSKDTIEGEVGLYFPVECELSEKFLYENSLYRHSQNNKNQAEKGFFEDNGRVKAMKFRGHKSAGFWTPLTSLNYIDWAVVNFKEGTEFNSINGQLICRKYIPAYLRNRKAKGNNLKELTIKDMVDTRCFKEHESTSHLFKFIGKLRVDDYITISTKLHGTSLRVGNVPVLRKLSWLERLASKLGVKVEKSEYKYVVGSRRVIKSVEFNELEGKKHYLSKDLWTEASKKFFEGKLHKGEVVYAEIIGWDGNAEIQKGYSYGYPKGTYDVYVYRIARTNPDGIVQDLPYARLKDRCNEMGVKCCPIEFEGRVGDFIDNFDRIDSQVVEDLIKKHFLERMSVFSTDTWKMPEEGIVVQVHKLGISDFYKAKSFAFLEHESKVADKGEVDKETMETEEIL